jgi:uncharacterized protein YecT (DUF1311 family)
MKPRGLVYALMLCSMCFAQKPNTLSDCQKKATTQRELEVCADLEFRRVDAVMESIYQQLLSKAKGDATAERKIRDAQQLWLAFRDAQLEATYPHEDKQREYGSAYPMCVLHLKTELTKERTKMLSKMLNPIEGEVCHAGLRYNANATTNDPDKWPGKWIGPEGTYLLISKNGDKYTIEIHSLDGPATYEGTSADDHIEFQRDGKTQAIRAGSGEETGMKWLLDKKNCLIIRTGEGFCRD